MHKSIKPKDLPSPPQTALNVLQACSDENVDFSEISDIVTNDPQLTAEILSMVNSAFYSRGQSVNSLNQAISIIGTRSLRNLCLCLSVKEVFTDSKLSDDFLSQFWTNSIIRAVSAKQLGQELKLDQDECFTLGLLQDFGLLVLFYLNPEKIEIWPVFCETEPNHLIELEQKEFGTTHTEVFKLMGQHWSLPGALIDPIINHHQCDLDKKNSLCNILNAADWLTYVLMSHNVKTSSDRCKQHITQQLSLANSDIEDCLNDISVSSNLAAEAMGMKINPIPDYSELLMRSNIRLAEDNIQIQELNWKLQETILERDRLSEELDREIGLASEVQESLLPEDSHLPVFAFNIPARDLSGDFYDFQKLKDGNILFCLADVSGKGINASLLMVKVSSLFHCLGKYVPDLKKLISIINNELADTSIRGMFVTFICGKYQPLTGRLEIINAGHPPALIMSDNGAIRVNSSSIPLGISHDIEFVSETFSLTNSILYLFSDGITESKKNNTELGVEGLITLLKAVRQLKIPEQLEQIKNKFLSSVTIAHDDMTMLIVDGK